jgi:hypothetical protein
MYVFFPLVDLCEPLYLIELTRVSQAKLNRRLSIRRTCLVAVFQAVAFRSDQQPVLSLSFSHSFQALIMSNFLIQRFQLLNSSHFIWYLGFLFFFFFFFFFFF